MSTGHVEATGRTKAQDKAGQEQEPQRARLIGQDVQDVAHEARQGSCQNRHLEAVLCPDAVACTVQKDGCVITLCRSLSPRVCEQGV